MKIAKVTKDNLFQRDLFVQKGFKNFYMNPPKKEAILPMEGFKKYDEKSIEIIIEFMNKNDFAYFMLINGLIGMDVPFIVGFKSMAIAEEFVVNHNAEDEDLCKIGEAILSSVK